MANPYIGPKLFAFLRELAQNNNKEWFEAHRDRFEADVRALLLAFITDFDVHLKQISLHFVADARKVGGSLFRIHRDVRFSKDKSPYKTNAGVQFRHELARDAHALGYYLHLDPKDSFVGVGIWHPDTATARMIRAAITEQPDAWLAARNALEDFVLEGNSLKRPPSGVAADHSCLTDPMRKDWVGVRDITQKALGAATFMEDFARLCEGTNPFMRFLSQALDVPF